MGQAHVTCHLSGAFAGILDVCRMLGALIVSNHGVRLLALLRFVDSSVGMLAITWLGALIVVL